MFLKPLITLYGQQAARITGLRLDDVDLGDDGVRLRLAGQHWVEIPEPLATLVRAHCDRRRNTSTAANAHCPWLFPASSPASTSARCAWSTRSATPVSP